MSNLLREQAYLLTPEELEELSSTTDGVQYNTCPLLRLFPVLSRPLSVSLSGYSGADMANLCREAAYGPVREAAETIQHISADDV